jgi:uncharacterized protein YkwD
MRPLLYLLFLSAAAQSIRAADPPQEHVSAAAILAELNFARQSPSAYAGLLLQNKPSFLRQEGVLNETVAFLRRTQPRPPLTLSPGLCQAAADHCRDQARGAMGHNGNDGSSPAARINRYGTPVQGWGENIAYGHRTAREIVLALIIDDGVRGRGHRKNIFNPAYHLAGAAYGQHARFGSVCDIDFASGYIEKAAVARVEITSPF